MLHSHVNEPFPEVSRQRTSKPRTINIQTLEFVVWRGDFPERIRAKPPSHICSDPKTYDKCLKISVLQKKRVRKVQPAVQSFQGVILLVVSCQNVIRMGHKLLLGNFSILYMGLVRKKKLTVLELGGIVHQSEFLMQGAKDSQGQKSHRDYLNNLKA